MCTQALKRLCVCLLLACSLSLAVIYAVSASNNSNSNTHALDGMRFVGETGEIGKKANNPDTITFEDGMFRSTSCEGHGFGPAPYSVKKQGDTYTFTTTLVSADTGKLVWMGTIVGDTLNATFRWTHKRFYVWTIERDYWYKGSRQPALQ